MTLVFDAPPPSTSGRWYERRRRRECACRRGAGGASARHHARLRCADREIIEPERIVFTATLKDEPGHEILTTVTFAGQEGKTKLTGHQTFIDTAMTRGAQEGWTQSLDRLTEYLAKG